MSLREALSDATRHWLDAASFGVVFATLVNWLPSMAAGASLLWSLVRLYETATVQRILAWIGRKLRRNKQD
ncbi:MULTISPECIES: hypothetical protein [unclassified Sphingopyxis]|uniref:hypothetical protein n=1 Tax=unclassified Sphingopyxis TaxID=2614943 RepID=UPI0028558DE2|nr:MULTISPECIES: hypothetical protein [unclassified Sphingopyxis]MDR7062000.1 hypothetical protein [Sphingopyxis sp. BE235]MDR7182459.1 hypothetical protein [Sphingopyxis sp. BE249]